LWWLRIQGKVGVVLPTDSHRWDKAHGGKKGSKAKRVRTGASQADPIEPESGSDSDESVVEMEEGWTEWVGDLPLEVTERIHSNPTNKGSKVFHLRRVLSSSKSTCHGVLRDAAGEPKIVQGRRKRCGQSVVPGSIQPGYYGDITYSKVDGVFLDRPGYVWFCLSKACVEKRHQSAPEQPLLPGTWPVAKETNMSTEEVEQLLQAGFVAEMKELNAQSEDEETTHAQNADEAAVPIMRWERKYKRSNMESKDKRKVALRAEHISDNGLLNVARTFVEGEFSKTWLITVNDEKEGLMHKVTFSQYPECSCRAFEALKTGKKAYLSCQHLKAVLHMELGIPYNNTIIDAPTLSKKEVHAALNSRM
jgi:hypothetical protein